MMQRKFSDGELIFNIPLICSVGGIPYNEKHIEYWKQQASTANTEIGRLREALRVNGLRTGFDHAEIDAILYPSKNNRAIPDAVK